MEPNTNFYSNTGQVVCYSPDGEHIYLWDGIPVAHVVEEKVYSFSGLLLGWFTNGWLYDRNNQPSLFSDGSGGGPARPAKHAKPAKAARQARPAKAARQAAHARPARSISWSQFSGDSYFAQ
jgi:hypothetical protein